MTKTLFTYAVLLNPKKAKDGEEQEHTKMIVEPTHILAKDEKSLTMQVVRKIPEQYENDLDRVSILIRPF